MRSLSALFLSLCAVVLPAADSALQTATYTADTTSEVMNPERGWHKNVNLIGGDNYAAVRTSSGMTLARTYVRLDAYRNSAIPQSVLDEHTQRFAQVRAAGIKLVLRYSYNFGMESDAPLDRVLQHIEQLKPYWRANADVIAVLQGGFIGAWGEWHSSTNGLASDANKATIANALLSAMPTSRMVQIRYPLAIRYIFPTPITPAAAFNGSNITRVGVMNDSFLRNVTDAGTYEGPPNWWFDQSLFDYVVAMSPSVVMGGETVEDVPWTVGNRQDGPAAMAEMAKLHWDYLNRDYALSVINPWIADGTYVQMSRKMGYRLRLNSATLPRTAASGSVLSGIQLDLANDGWGKVYNPRRLDLILRNTQSGVAHRIELSADARRLLPLGGETRSIQIQGQLPILAVGTYTVLLHLGDPEVAILARPEYSIRLANQNLWESATGYHALGMTLEIQGSAPSNAAPQVGAGPDRNVTLPNAASLAGTALDDGLPSGSTLSVTWTKISGPGTVAFAQAGVAATTATFSQAGTYVLQLTASDGALSSQDTVTVVASAAPPGGAGTGLTGTYFPSVDFTGTSITRIDATVNFDWGNGSPASGVGVDNFSVRWTGQVQAQFSETYTFSTMSDDGVRLWVNGQQLVNNWTVHGPTEDSGTITLVAGQKYELTMEFYDSAWGAMATLSWASPSTAKQIIPMTQLYPAAEAGTGTGLTGTYFSDTTLTNAVATRTDATVDFDWGNGSPASGVGVDNFSVRWSGQVQAQFSETYTFSTMSDDGVRLWVNGQQLVNNWTDHAPTEDSGTITLMAGQKYDLTMEFYENGGGAMAKLSWASPSTAKQIVPMTRLFPSGGTPGALPAGWTAQDVGGVALGGSTTQSNGTWTVVGSGADIWNNADGCRFASQRVSGDVQVTARVVSLTNTNEWAKAGVMIRESLSTGSRQASTFATATNGLAYQRRLATDGVSSHTAGPGSPTPYWVRLERVGNLVISSASPNGTAWTEIRRETIAMGAAVYAGLAVTSHTNGALCTATFTNVQVVGVAAAAN